MWNPGGAYQTKSEVFVNGPKKSWTPVASGFQQSTQWNPAPSVSFPAGGTSFGGGTSFPPMASGDQDVIWDEARGGYWIKETIMDAGYSTTTNSGRGSAGGYYGGGGYSSGGGGSGGYVTTIESGNPHGWTGCRGCASVPAKGSCGCNSSVGMSAPRSSGCGCQSGYSRTTVISQPACNCSSKAIAPQSAFLYAGRPSGGCRAGSTISCGCHTQPSCTGCGAYH